METASLHLAHRWYLGYHLDEPLPDHSALTRIRQRLGVPIFRRFFEHVVELCVQAGLVWGRELFFDATKVRANASLDSLEPRLRLVVDEHLGDIFASDEPDTVAGDAAAAATAAPEPARAHWDLLEECRLDPERPTAWGYQRIGHLRVSSTDPDAAPMKARGQRAALERIS